MRHRARIEAERRRRRGSRRQRGARRLRHPVVVGAAIAVVVVVVVAAVLALRAGDGNGNGDGDAVRAGSVAVPGAPPVEITRAPSAYRIVFRAESGRGKNLVVSTDKAWVRRPWESRLESWTGAPPGDKRLSQEVAGFAVRRTQSEGQDPLTLAVVPQVPAADVRLQPALASAIERGLVVRREVREVAGRRCQVYRSGAYFSDASFSAPTAEAHADSCVDEAGLVLEEVLVSDGRRIGRRVAVEVEEDPVLDATAFAAGPPTVEVKDGGGFVRRADPSTRPEGEYLEPPEPPAGFGLRGLYTVVPPQPENFTDPVREGQQVAGTADVYERGLDLLVIDQGGTLRGAAPFVADPANPTEDLGPLLGAGEVLLGPRGSEIRVARPGGRYVRIFGTLPPAELAAIGRSLQAVQGSGLAYVE